MYSTSVHVFMHYTITSLLQGSTTSLHVTICTCNWHNDIQYHTTTMRHMHAQCHAIAADIKLPSRKVMLLVLLDHKLMVARVQRHLHSPQIQWLDSRWEW